MITHIVQTELPNKISVCWNEDNLVTIHSNNMKMYWGLPRGFFSVMMDSGFFAHEFVSHRFSSLTCFLLSL